MTKVPYSRHIFYLERNKGSVRQGQSGPILCYLSAGCSGGIEFSVSVSRTNQKQDKSVLNLSTYRRNGDGVTMLVKYGAHRPGFDKSSAGIVGHQLKLYFIALLVLDNALPNAHIRYQR